jgi:hypothetical protein
VLQNDILHTRHVLCVDPVLPSRTDEILIGEKIIKNHMRKKCRAMITSREESIDTDMTF